MNMSDIITKLISSIKTFGSKGGNIELEFRVKEVKDPLLKVISLFKNYNFTVNKTIDYINNSSGDIQKKHIKSNLYNGENRVSSNIYVKNSLISPIKVENLYTISVSEEINDSKNYENKYDLARLKTRFSCNDVVKDWRLDITFSYTNKNINELVHDKIQYFNNINSVNDIPTKYRNQQQIEFELEYTGNITQLNEVHFQNVDNFIKTIIHEITVKDNSTLDKIYKMLSVPSKNVKTVKQLSNSPIELSRLNWQKIRENVHNYCITDKIDGIRTIVLLEKNTVYWVNDKENGSFDTDNDLNCIIILDTELYKNNTFYIFDIMYYNVNVTELSFDKRLSLIDRVMDLKLSNRLQKKMFVNLTNNYLTEIKNMLTSEKKYETDGIIINSIEEDYKSSVYKYKLVPTIDFYLVEHPNEKPQNHKYRYIMCNGIKSSNLKLFVKTPKDILSKSGNYVPIQFEPCDLGMSYLYDSDLDLNGKVCEFKIVNNEFVMIHERTDRQKYVESGRYFGNDFIVAESIYFNIKYPIDLSSNTKYFLESDNDEFKVVRKFNNMVKRFTLETVSGSKTCIDLASGKGQDLLKYNSLNIGSNGILFVEKDVDAIIELVSRKNNMTYTNKMKTFVLEKDITKLKSSDVHKFMLNTELIVCNLAFHYFTGNERTLNIVVDFVNGLLKMNGTFIITAFDGKSIVDLLKDGNWETNKYSIRKKYSANILQLHGQEIELKLPFSKGNYYSEYLVNAEYLSSKLSAKGINLTSKHSFANYLSKFSDISQLSNDDITFIKLYHVYVFKRT